MSQDYTFTETSHQLSLTDGNLGGEQVMVCLGSTGQAPWNTAVNGLDGWTDADADAFISAVVAAYHQYAPAGSAPGITYNRVSRDTDQVIFTVDPATGEVS